MEVCNCRKCFDLELCFIVHRNDYGFFWDIPN